MASWTFFFYDRRWKKPLHQPISMVVADRSTINRQSILIFIFGIVFLPRSQKQSFSLLFSSVSNDCRMMVLGTRAIRVFIVCFSCVVLYGDRTAIKCTHQSMFDHKICINFCCCFLLLSQYLSLTFRWLVR